MALTKQVKSHFAPGTLKRAHYADINFDMLGEIIEKITNLSLEDAFKLMIYHPLALEHTYLPTSEQDHVPDVYYKETSIHRPKYVACSRASGGAISTAR